MMVLAVGLALISSGCASIHPSATPSVVIPPAATKPLDAQQQPEDPQKEYALQNNPVGESVYFVNGLAELGTYLFGGK
jgi:hypothetical protein